MYFSISECPLHTGFYQVRNHQKAIYHFEAMADGAESRHI